jgi:hypothetical protein
MLTAGERPDGSGKVLWAHRTPERLPHHRPTAHSEPMPGTTAATELARTEMDGTQSDKHSLLHFDDSQIQVDAKTL